MRIFGGETVERLMDRFGIAEDVPLESGLVSGAIGNAQKRVEGYNFDLRKHLVDYDNVMNRHREIAYAIRRRILAGGEETEKFLLEKLVPVSSEIKEIWAKRKKEFSEVWLKLSQQLSLQTFDILWIEHIDTMEELRRGIGLRGYGGRDPLVEYQKEARDLFDRLIGGVWSTIADRLTRVEIKPQEEKERAVILRHPSHSVSGATEVDLPEKKIGRPPEKLGRNDPCWCGSGKKWKKCHYPELGSSG